MKIKGDVMEMAKKDYSGVKMVFKVEPIVEDEFETIILEKEINNAVGINAKWEGNRFVIEFVDEFSHPIEIEGNSTPETNNTNNELKKEPVIIDINELRKKSTNSKP